NCLIYPIPLFSLRRSDSLILIQINVSLLIYIYYDSICSPVQQSLSSAGGGTVAADARPVAAGFFGHLRASLALWSNKNTSLNRKYKCCSCCCGFPFPRHGANEYFDALLERVLREHGAREIRPTLRLCDKPYCWISD